METSCFASASSACGGVHVTRASRSPALARILRKRSVSTTPQSPKPALPDSFFWLLLASVAGGVNAGAYLSCQRFVSHVTGTATLIGVDLGSWELALDYALVLACFCAGAAVAVFMVDGKKKRDGVSLVPAPRPWAAPVVVVTLIIAAVAVAGWMNAFGEFGKTVETAADFVLLSALGFSMGLLNGAVGRAASNQRITHLTGEATDLGVQLAAGFMRNGTARKEAFLGASLKAGKIGAFIAGVAVVAAVASTWEFLCFLVPAALSTSAVVLSIAVDRALAYKIARLEAERVAEAKPRMQAVLASQVPDITHELAISTRSVDAAPATVR